ncbi:MAG TPA: transglycosylase SLT domain-containing protein [Terracidiphilus sp.]|nr:transglycosylase SLT domain-containing protein [Terracidiphilus sp.]
MLLVPPLLAIVLAGCGPEKPVSASNPQQPQATAPAIPAPAVAPKPAQAAAPQQPSAAEQQRVHDLIQQVEAAYARGDADYKKGMLAEAKTEFDRAVDLMLSSGIDIRSNQQLSDEFDHIVDQVNSLEMEALKQGNGFVPKEEITPAEAASDVTFAVDPNLVAKARADLATTKSDLPLMMNDYVAAYINFFAYTQKGHNTLLHSFQRSGRYRAMIQRVMAEEGVPQDLIYLAVAESGFNPRALNPRSHAGGMWQFMPHGNYGLERNTYVDERFDPEKSTRAYARYMKYIYDQLGDWYLAMAAYDHGAGNIQREVEKTGYADFWELYKRHELPTETANYVPEILAAIIIANHPTQYGFDDVTLDPPVLTDTVTVNYSIDLRLVSDLVGAPVDELEALNPSLLRMETPPDSSFDLHLPAGTADLFNERVDLIPEAHRSSWRYHAVVAGDTMASVAAEYRVRPAELADANQLAESDSLAGKDALIVPVAPELAPSARTAYYTTRRGDTLVTIADRFGVSLAQLRRWNNLSGAGVKVEAGRRLHVAEPVARVHRASVRRHTPSSGTKANSAGTRKSTHKKTPAGTAHKRTKPASNSSQK